jgi:hypothetical protein
VPLDFEFDPEIDAEYARRLDPGDPLSISA